MIVWPHHPSVAEASLPLLPSFELHRLCPTLISLSLELKPPQLKIVMCSLCVFNLFQDWTVSIRVYCITICIDFLPCNLQCCPVTQSVPHTLIFPHIILCMLVEHSQVDSCQWTSQDTLAHQIKLYVVHLFYCNSLLLYKRSTCEKGKYLVLPVTYICTICSSLLQLKRKNAAYSCIK